MSADSTSFEIERSLIDPEGWFSASSYWSRRILLQLGLRLQQSLKHDDSSTGTGRGRRKCDDKPITKVELQQGWDYDFNSLSNRHVNEQEPQQVCGT